MNHVSLYVVKERFRSTLRQILFCMVLIGTVFAVILQANEYQGWTRPLFIAVLFGVPGGLALFFVYRILRFAVGR